MSEKKKKVQENEVETTEKVEVAVESENAVEEVVEGVAEQETVDSENSALDATIVPSQSKKNLIFKIVAIVVAGVLLLTNIATGLILFLKDDVAATEEDNQLFSDVGLIKAKSGDKWGYIDVTGKFIINPQFDSATSFVDGLAVVKSGDKWGYINKEGKYVINLQFDDASNFSEGLALVESGDKYGYINKEGKYVINLQFDAATDFTDGIALVEVEDKIGLIDKAGNYIVSPQFEDSQDEFSNGLLAVKSGGKWGYIDKEGNLIINYQFVRADSMCDDGYAVVATTDKKFTVIDKKGNQINGKFDGVDGYSYTFCTKENCYNMASDGEYCSTHEEKTYTSSTGKYCRAYGCYNIAYYGNYCSNHGYLE